MQKSINIVVCRLFNVLAVASHEVALRAIGERDVVVSINSPGGDFFEGIAIYNLLREHPYKITVKVVGLAASAASVIAMSGDEIQVAKTGFLMIHNAWVFAIGNRHDLREAATVLDEFDGVMADLYAESTGKKKKDIEKMMDAETWMGGQAAVDAGFASSLLPADEIVEDAGSDSTSNASLRKVESILAQQGLPRSERRELLRQITGGMPGAASRAMPGAGSYGIGQSAGGQVDLIPGNKVMHLRGLTLDGFMGLNPIAYARESIGLELATEKHGAKLFSHGTNIGGVLQMPAGQLFKDRTKAQAFLDDFNNNYSSVENAHKAALLENGVTWTKMGMTSIDSQFLEARRFQHRQIVDLFFSLPLSIMTSEDKTATFASSEQFSIAFVIYALMPYIINIEQAIYRDLLNEEEKKTLYAKFEARSLLRGSFRDQMEAFQIGINTEIYSPNEVREMLEANPYDGGDEYRTRTSTTKDTGGAAEVKK